MWMLQQRRGSLCAGPGLAGCKCASLASDDQEGTHGTKGLRLISQATILPKRSCLLSPTAVRAAPAEAITAECDPSAVGWARIGDENHAYLPTAARDYIDHIPRSSHTLLHPLDSQPSQLVRVCLIELLGDLSSHPLRRSANQRKLQAV